MMEIIGISELNLELYEEALGLEASDNIGRANFRGAVAVAGGGSYECLAATSWELMHPRKSDEEQGASAEENLDGSGQTEVRLGCLAMKDKEAGELLLSECLKWVDAARYYAEIPLIIEEAGKQTGFASAFSDQRAIVRNRFAREVLEKTGFRIEERESRDLIVTVSDLSGIKLPKPSEKSSNIKEFGTLGLRAFRNGMADCVRKSKRKLQEDIQFLPYNWYDQELSCYTEKDGDVTGFLLVHRMPSGRHKIELLEAHGKDFQSDVINMIAFSVKQAGRLLTEGTEIVIQRRDELAAKATAYMLPSSKGRKVLYGELLKG